MKGGMELNSQKSFMPRHLRGPNYSLQTETADVARKRFHILSYETSDESPLLGPVSLQPQQDPPPPQCGERTNSAPFSLQILAAMPG